MQQNRTVILARVSSKSQEDEGYSLDSQLKLLHGYCEYKGLSVVKVFKIAETASKQQSRKVFQELLEFIKKAHVYHLAVEKTDRLTRNFKDAVAIEDWLDKDANRMLHAVKENIQLTKDSKSDAKFMWNIHLAVAKKYTDNLREEAMKGWAEKLAQGWLPSTPPPGYMTITQGGKRVHVPDPQTAPIMRQMFKRYLESAETILSITDAMREVGIRTRFGRPFAKSHVQKILNNPFYIGINRFNGNDHPGAQEHLITRELFEKVQYKMHKGRPPVLKQHNPVFKNLIRCRGCGGIVTWQLQKGHYYGACQRTSEQCKGRKLLREDRLEEIVKAMLEQLVAPSGRILEWTANAARAKQREGVERTEKFRNSIQAQVHRIKRMDEALYDDKLSGEIASEKYTAKHREFMAQKAELESKLDGLDDSLGLRLEQRLVLLELSQKASEIYDEKSPEKKRIIITKLFNNLTYENGFVSVTYTDFARAIAEGADETRNLMGGGKMNNQTAKNDPDNRYEEGHFEAENELRPIWLGR